MPILGTLSMAAALELCALGVAWGARAWAPRLSIMAAIIKTFRLRGNTPGLAGRNEVDDCAPDGMENRNLRGALEMDNSALLGLPARSGTRDAIPAGSGC